MVFKADIFPKSLFIETPISLYCFIKAINEIPKCLAWVELKSSVDVLTDLRFWSTQNLLLNDCLDWKATAPYAELCFGINLLSLYDTNLEYNIF